MAVEVTPAGTRGTELPKLPRWAAAAMSGISTTMFRLLGRRMRVRGLPVLLLTTIGARSGRERHAMLGYIADGPDAWLITATFGGSRHHPGWFHNLAAHPDTVSIEVGGRREVVRPSSLTGAERDRAWQRIVGAAPGYAPYAEQTDRLIPVVRLERVN